ncbi:zinc ribbon domain-containing protein [Bacillus cereus]|uniref:zinc ribbon domain-containing protein n=1 Tax=Bacillus cereus TaxID=1396 RepID=UPI00355B85ED
MLTRSLYCLSHFIEYKANLAGIKLEYVNPAYTSQTCSNCSVRNKAKDRTIVCGLKQIGSGELDICYTPRVDGKPSPCTSAIPIMNFAFDSKNPTDVIQLTALTVEVSDPI